MKPTSPATLPPPPRFFLVAGDPPTCLTQKEQQARTTEFPIAHFRPALGPGRKVIEVAEDRVCEISI